MFLIHVYTNKLSLTSIASGTATVGAMNGWPTYGTSGTDVYKEINVSFGKTFSSAPHVVGMPSREAYRGCCAVVSVSTTGCRFRIDNLGSGAATNIKIDWIAVL